MTAIAQFNQLGGKTVSRNELIALMTKAFDEQSFEVHTRIVSVLDTYPNATDFTLEIEQPIQQINIGLGSPSIESLGAARHSGLEKEGLDECGRLNPGYKYLAGGQIVKTGSVQMTRIVKGRETKTATTKAKKPLTTVKKSDEKPKKLASNYGKKRPFVKKPKIENNAFDFLYEVTRKGYFIKTFLELPTSQSVKFREISESVNNLRYYDATEKGLAELKKLYKNSKYGDRNSYGSKDLLNPNPNDTPTPNRSSNKASNYGKKRKFVSRSEKYPFSKEDIPYETAYRAFTGTSFSPEKRAIEEQNSYFAFMKEVYDENLKKANQADKVAEFEKYFTRFKDGYLKRSLDYLRSKHGIFSTMIAGPSNFPVRRMEKKNNIANNKLNELLEYSEKGQNIFLDIVTPESKKVIKTGSSSALGNLQIKLEEAEKQHSLGLAGNKLLKKLRANKEATEQTYVDAFVELGFDLETAKKEARYMFKYDYAGFFTTNTGAKVRRLKGQIELENKLKQKAEKMNDDTPDILFQGGSIKNDYSDNRIKIFFDSIPSAEIRSFLKKGGQAFKWSPFNKAWQRQLNTYYKGSRTDLYNYLGVEMPKELELQNSFQTENNPVEKISGLSSPNIIPLEQPEAFTPSQIITKGNSVGLQEKPKQANKLMQMEFDSLEMDEGWEELMQDPAANMKIMLLGKPKNGKTAGALKFANYLTKFGNVLYNFADQGFNKSTQDLWRLAGLEFNTKAEPSAVSTLDELENEIATGKYRFIFIDMISDYIRKEKIKPEEFKERFIKAYPETSFILVFEVTKNGIFKGDQGWEHVVDAIMDVENFVMKNRGRYGFGEMVIYEAGFEKMDPKGYAEWLENQHDKELQFSEEIEQI